MNRKVTWLMLSCLMVTVLLVASCGTAATDEEESRKTATQTGQTWEMDDEQSGIIQQL